jgi:peptidoglycan-associated lipoprotein
MGRSLRLISVLCVALAVTACAKNPNDESLANGLGANGGLNGRSAAPGSIQDFSVNVGDRVYFDFDAFAIRSDAQPVLAAQAAWLKRYPAVQVRIEGNADEKGTREYNLALGARRANSVRDFLIAQGVESSRIATVSYGKEKPIDFGTGDEADQRNRNGHTAIVSGARMQ